jgi:hypothetical protein
MKFFLHFMVRLLTLPNVNKAKRGCVITDKFQEANSPSSNVHTHTKIYNIFAGRDFVGNFRASLVPMKPVKS